MTKGKRRLTISKLPADQRSFEPWVNDARPDVEVHRELLQQCAAGRFTQWPREIAAFLDGVAESCVEVYWPNTARPDEPLTRSQIAVMIRNAVHEGYSAAVMDYSADIQQSHEASVEYDNREHGGNKGREKQSQASEARHQLIRDKWVSMEAAGEKVTNETVAAAIRADGVRCSRSTVIRAFKTKPASPAAKRTRTRRR
jgi:hypothetical protein